MELGRIAIRVMGGAIASIGGAAIAQAPIQPVYNAMGAYWSGMTNVVSLGQPLAFQAENARLKAEGQRGNRTTPLPAPSAHLTFAPGNGAQTVNAYVARISRQDPTAGGQLRTALAGKNIPAIFNQLVQPFGLNDHDVADAMAAHLIMRAMVVTGAQPPSPQGVRNVRDSVVRALAHDPKMASEAYRGQIGGEAQLDFVLVNTTWRAIGEGKWPAEATAQYRRAVAESLAREGIDLNTTQLTAEGFSPK
jgi:hypothetical protein